MDQSEPKWIAILRAEVATSNATQVATAIGYSRTAVSLVLSGKYQGGTDKIADAVLSTFANRILCPHLQADITPVECRDFQSRPMPQSEAHKLRHWMACQTCEHRECVGTVLVGNGEAHAHA